MEVEERDPSEPWEMCSGAAGGDSEEEGFREPLYRNTRVWEVSCGANTRVWEGRCGAQISS